jgi:hypothetical protein
MDNRFVSARISTRVTHGLTVGPRNDGHNKDATKLTEADRGNTEDKCV